MANNVANIQIFGGDDGKVWMSPVGSTAPVGLAAPVSPWVDLGWLSEEGVTLGESPDVSDFYAHQGGTQVASVILREEKSLKFQCLETTAKQAGLYWSGLTIATTGTAPNEYHGGEIKGARSVSKAFIYDDYSINQTLADGVTPVMERYIIPKATVGEKAELVYKRDQIRVWDFTIKILGSYFFYTNNPAFAAV